MKKSIPKEYEVVTVGVSRHSVEAIQSITQERDRQVHGEVMPITRDDGYHGKELACYAVATLLLGIGFSRAAILNFIWPNSWFQSWLKDAPYRRLLVKAGAAIVAEIERVDRATLREKDLSTPSAPSPASRDDA